MKEIWKDVIGYDGLYEVSNQGNVRRSRDHMHYNSRPWNLKQSLDRKGYFQLSLSMNKIQKPHAVHRLVAYAFCGLTPDKVVNHINGNRTDNRACNLESVSASENEKHKWKVIGTGARTNSTITMKDAEKIRAMSRAGMKNSQIAKHFPITRMSVWNIVNNRTWVAP